MLEITDIHLIFASTQLQIALVAEETLIDKVRYYIQIIMGRESTYMVKLFNTQSLIIKLLKNKPIVLNYAFKPMF